MKLLGDIYQIKTALDYIQMILNFLDSEEYIYLINIELLKNKEPVLLIDKATLKEYEAVITSTKIQSIDVIKQFIFIINKSVYELFNNSKDIIKTSTPEYTNQLNKNTLCIQTTKPFNEIQNNKKEKFINNYEKKTNNTLSLSQTSLDNKLYIIEEHATDCEYKQRPAVIGIKQLDINYFLLFYRKSVFDFGLDTNFRRYLTEQPGNLVAYRYFNKIDNLRSSFNDLGLCLKHNGKNELSLTQANKLLSSINVLRYL